MAVFNCAQCGNPIGYISVGDSPAICIDCQQKNFMIYDLTDSKNYTPQKNAYNKFEFLENEIIKLRQRIAELENQLRESK